MTSRISSSLKPGRSFTNEQRVGEPFGVRVVGAEDHAVGAERVAELGRLSS